jgi:hypothetical protein
MRVADLLGRDGQQALQQVLVVLVQQRTAPAASLVAQRRGVEGLGVSLDPVVDALAGHAKHPGDVGGGAATGELQDSEGTAKQAGVTRLGELAPEAPPLPGSQGELAHVLLLDRWSCP